MNGKASVKSEKASLHWLLFWLHENDRGVVDALCDKTRRQQGIESCSAKGESYRLDAQHLKHM